jgi:Bax protein
MVQRIVAGIPAGPVGLAALCAAAFALFAAGLPGLHLGRDLTLPAPAPSALVNTPATLAEPPADPADRSGPPAAIDLTTTTDIHEAFALLENSGFDLKIVRDGGRVPRVFFTALPGDLAELEPVEARKTVFLKVVLPLILKHNESIAADRHRLLALRAALNTADLSPADAAWLVDLSEAYGVIPGAMDELVKRVDTVPPSLALAQTIHETGWGTSRFAREGNALFGEHTEDPDASGMVPSRRQAGGTFRVRSFAGLLDAVERYTANLNTGAAYAGFRDARLAMRRDGRARGGLALAGTLTRYSELGERYVRALRALILRNNLAVFDGARLSRGDDTRIIFPGV